MATHIKSFLEQILAEKDLSTDNWQLYRHALSYAKLGDQLDMEEWELLNGVEGFGDILEYVQNTLLPKYTAEWEKVGCPRNWEDWMETLSIMRQQQEEDYQKDLASQQWADFEAREYQEEEERKQQARDEQRRVEWLEEQERELQEQEERNRRLREEEEE